MRIKAVAIGLFIFILFLLSIKGIDLLTDSETETKPKKGEVKILYGTVKE